MVGLIWIALSLINYNVRHSLYHVLFMRIGMGFGRFLSIGASRVIGGGIKLSNMRVSQEILSNRQSSLLQSTVSLGNCTGAFVSNNGLILTNKHCLAQDANLIQSHSPPKEQKQEFPLQNTKFFVFDSYRDVSKDVLQKGNSEEDIQKHINHITRRCENFFVTSFLLTTKDIHSSSIICIAIFVLFIYHHQMLEYMMVENLIGLGHNIVETLPLSECIPIKEEGRKHILMNTNHCQMNTFLQFRISDQRKCTHTWLSKSYRQKE